MNLIPLTGRPEVVISSLRRKVSALTKTRSVSVFSFERAFKIGITNNPDARWRCHRKIYDEMIIVYVSNSLKHIKQLETALIDHNWDLGDNLIGGGGGNYGNPPYYLYLLRQY